MTQPQHPPHNSKWNIIEALNWTSDYFESHNIDSPRICAEIFLAHVLNVRRIDLYLRHDQPLHQEELKRFKLMIKRRITREPMAYIIGNREFWSMDFKVTKDTLIPRPETELLVESALSCLTDESFLDQHPRPCRILDLGTGSGAVILALAKEKPGHLFFATDRCYSALAVAGQNAEANGLKDRISFIAGDWFSAFKKRCQFDIIVSNPPYIPTKTIEALQPEILLFEPKSALDGGETGFHSLNQIAFEAPEFLKPDGYLLMEMGYDQKKGMQKISRDAGFYSKVEFIKDYSGHDRVVKLKKDDSSGS